MGVPSEHLANFLGDQAITFQFAGMITTKEAIYGLLINLLRHPTVYDRILHEHAALARRHLQIDAACLHEATYTTAVITETLRSVVPVPTVMRMALRPMEATLEDGRRYYIPEGSVLYVALDPGCEAVDPDHARTFNPTRCEPAHARAREPEMLPFGAGVRTCLGRGAAIGEMQLLLAVLARRGVRFQATGGKYRMEDGRPISYWPTMVGEPSEDDLSLEITFRVEEPGHVATRTTAGAR